VKDFPSALVRFVAEHIHGKIVVMEEIGGDFEDGKNSDPNIQGLALCPGRQWGYMYPVAANQTSCNVLPCTVLADVFTVLEYLFWVFFMLLQILISLETG